MGTVRHILFWTVFATILAFACLVALYVIGALGK
jgi:hypothetical protein